MGKYTTVKYRLQEKMYPLINKDPMIPRIKRYRESGMLIGNNARIFSKLSTGEPYLIEIGNDVSISTNVSLITHDNSAIKCFEKGTDFIGKIVIGNNCFIGSGAIILPGVTLPDNTIVGAGSVVAYSIDEPGKVIAGNPAKVVGSIERMRKKYQNNVFDFSGEKQNEKRKIIENGADKYIKK